MSGRVLLLGGVVLAVVGAVVAAIFVLDSPAEMRRQKLDDQRARDLQGLESSIESYWQENGALPPSLEALAHWQHLDAPPTDPASGASYRYRITGDTTYELCATFASDTPDDEARPGHWPHYGKFWRHPAGEHCFELELGRDDL